jgi:receptor-type tyrosine-protein phosphatase gamma
MVWDNNSSQIVCLQSEETESCEPYWLPLGECMKCGDSFTVQLREENFDMDFVLRDFLLQSIDEDYEFNCRMITACYWPDSCTPIKTAFDLVNKVKMFRLQSQQVQGQNSSNCSSSNGNNPMMAALGCGVSMANLPPLIVHDLCGSFRAATFCALYTFQDLVHLESSVNVYETAKMFYLKRPGLWAHKVHTFFNLNYSIKIKQFYLFQYFDNFEFYFTKII